MLRLAGRSRWRSLGDIIPEDLSQRPSTPPADQRSYDRFRELYLYLDPEIMAAIRAGDRRGARKFLNYEARTVRTVRLAHPGAALRLCARTG